MQNNLPPTLGFECLEDKESIWLISGSNILDTFKKSDFLGKGDSETLKGVRTLI